MSRTKRNGSVKPAAKKPTFDQQLRGWARNETNAYLKRFRQLMEEHGRYNLVVFPLNDVERQALRICSDNHNLRGVPKGDRMAFAKNSLLACLESGLDEIAGKAEADRLRKTFSTKNGKAKQ